MKPVLYAVTVILAHSAVQGTCVLATETVSRSPNVLFISVDDLNDWVSLFGGHPQAKTPNLDRLARRGAMVFQNAVCPGPVCGPSRSALLSGYMPHRTGVYGNSQNMLASKLIAENPTLPEYFSQHGYATLSRGKIFHAHGTPTGLDRGQWAFQNYVRNEDGTGVDRQRVTSKDKNLVMGRPAEPSEYAKGGGSEFAFGPTRGTLEEMSDFKTAKWAATMLRRQRESAKPFFMAVGFSKPHLPFYVPQSFFDLYPIDEVELPAIKPDDLDDIRTPRGKPKFSATSDYLWLQEKGQLKRAVQAYLAAISFADACVGHVVDALENSTHADNTIVVVWGDHGWHLGEKLRFRKATGFYESTRCPLIIRAPWMKQRLDCNSVVSLIDLYPTLVDYCGLPKRAGLDGVSLVPLLKDPKSSVQRYVTTIFGQSQAAITDGRWHFARHRDGTRELYDLKADPNCWTNLANKPDDETAAIMQRFESQFPSHFADPVKQTPRSVKKRAKGLSATPSWPRLGK